jgi:hypothetical protein
MVLESAVGTGTTLLLDIFLEENDSFREAGNFDGEP